MPDDLENQRSGQPPGRPDAIKTAVGIGDTPRLLTRSFALLTVSHFLQALGWASILLLPLYLDHLGASRTQIGVIMATAAVGGLLLRPVVGWALDVLGRKPTIIAGTVMLAFGMILLFFVREIGVVIYLHRLFFGIGVGALFTGYFAFATDLIPARRRTEGIALFGVAGLLPSAFIPLIEQGGVEAAQLRLVYPVVGVLILLSLVPLIAVPEPKRPARTEPFTFDAVQRALRKPSLRPVWLATVVFACFVSTFMAFVTVVADNRGIEHPTAIWLAYAAGAIGVRVFGGRLPDRVGPANLVTPALAIYAFATLLAAGSWSVNGLVWAGILGGLGHGYCFPVLTAQVANRSPTHLRGTSLAMFTALWEASALLLTPVFGHVSDVYDDATMFSLLACLAFVALIFWVVLEHRHGRTALGERH